MKVLGLKKRWLILSFCAMTIQCFSQNITTLTYDATAQVDFGNPDLHLTLWSKCDGSVLFNFGGDRNVKNFTYTFNGAAPTVINAPGANPITSNTVYFGSEASADDNKYDINVFFGNYEYSTYVSANFQYKYLGQWFVKTIDVYYSHLGAQTLNSIDFEFAELAAPNLYNATYAGPFIPGPNYYYVFDWHETINNTFPEGGIWSPNALQVGQQLGENDPLYTIASPHFYCRANETLPQDYEVKPTLYIYKNYDALPDASGQQQFQCSNKVQKTIQLDNLCDYVGELSVVPGVNEFQPVVHTSDLTNSALAPFVTSHKLYYDWQQGQNSSQDVIFDNNYPVNYGNTPGTKTILELITFQGGCQCASTYSYNTNDPCMNMSNISYTIQYENGVNSFVFTPACYLGSATQGPYTYTLDFGDGSFATGVGSGSCPPSGTGPTYAHNFNGSGPFTVVQTTDFGGDSEPCVTYLTLSQAVILNNEYCCENFSLDNSTTAYWISAWVMEEHLTQQKTYENTFIEIEFLGGGNIVPPYQFYPTGDLVEGWQRIVGKFSIPTGALKMNIHLASASDEGNIVSYFDDVRIHPFNASMKSYVYDPETFWLTAELDDNNYATFYEYDNEGQLIRIKKETARGIMTIQESRSSNVIKHEE